MASYRSIAFAVLCLCAASPSPAAPTLVVSLFTGSAYNVPVPLGVRQEGFENLSLTARYETRPLEGSPYYSWRAGIWREEKGWELEFIHHKVYLENNPEEIQHFAVSHGYNLVSFNRAWKQWGSILHAGGGLVITHPENTVRGLKLAERGGLFDHGYRLSGVTSLLAMERRLRIHRGFFAALEGKVTASYARVPIVDGRASVPVVALHGAVGLGYSF